MPDEEATATTLYDHVGGAPFFQRLVDAFYDGVATDPVLLPLYPEQPDLTNARHRLTLFLAQYWGGPQTYNAERGHPRLRMRHVRFGIGLTERDAWVRHMRAAVEASDASTAARSSGSRFRDWEEYRRTASRLDKP